MKNRIHQTSKFFWNLFHFCIIWIVLFDLLKFPFFGKYFPLIVINWIDLFNCAGNMASTGQCLRPHSVANETMSAANHRICSNSNEQKKNNLWPLGWQRSSNASTMSKTNTKTDRPTNGMEPITGETKQNKTKNPTPIDFNSFKWQIDFR